MQLSLFYFVDLFISSLFLLLSCNSLVISREQQTVSLYLYPVSCRHKEAYTWTNPMCCVHNIILGKLWIEQYGTVEIINHRYVDEYLKVNPKPADL